MDNKTSLILSVIVGLLLLSTTIPIFVPMFTEYNGLYSSTTNITSTHVIGNASLDYDISNNKSMTANNKYYSQPNNPLYGSFQVNHTCNLTRFSFFGYGGTGQLFHVKIYNSTLNATNNIVPWGYNPISYQPAYGISNWIEILSTTPQYYTVYFNNITLKSEDTYNNTWFVSIVDEYNGIINVRWYYTNDFNNSITLKFQRTSLPTIANYTENLNDLCFNITVYYDYNQTLTSVINFYNTDVAYMVNTLLPVSIIVGIIITVGYKKRNQTHEYA